MPFNLCFNGHAWAVVCNVSYLPLASIGSDLKRKINSSECQDGNEDHLSDKNIKNDELKGPNNLVT